MLAFCALEAHVNATADELSERPELSIHERALLLEQDVRFDNGEFKVGGMRIVRLEDRILFCTAGSAVKDSTAQPVGGAI